MEILKTKLRGYALEMGNESEAYCISERLAIFVCFQCLHLVDTVIQ